MTKDGIFSFISNSYSYEIIQIVISTTYDYLNIEEMKVTLQTLIDENVHNSILLKRMQDIYEKLI